MALPANVAIGDKAGRFVSTAPALTRFLQKCEFDATTGCVLWNGGTTCGRGKSAPYGSFWYDGRRWFAHRWAAQFIHGLSIDGHHVDHCCPLDRAGPNNPLPPNTLCVRHVQPLPGAENSALVAARRTWILTQKGIYEPPPLFAEMHAPAPAMPLHDPPAWFPIDRPVNTALCGTPF